MPFVKGNTEASKKGKHVKTKQWEQLGEFITNSGAKRVMAYLDNLEDEEKFFTQYNQLLNFFKPKMQSTQLTSDSAIHIKVNVPDKDA